MASWFRSWHGAPTDNKWLVIGRRANVAPGVVSAVAWALFDHASQADDRGCVDGFDVETYAAFSGFDEGDVNRVVSAMREKSVIIDGRLAAWDKRQPKREDDSSERVRAFRERKSVTENSVTQCNAVKRTETTQNRTDTDTDTETDTKQTVVVVADAPDAGSVFTCWQNNIPGTMTQIISDELGDLIDTYGTSEVLYGITEGVRSGNRNIRYIAGVLKKRLNGDAKPTNGTPRNNGNGKATNLDRTRASFAELDQVIKNGGAA